LGMRRPTGELQTFPTAQSTNSVMEYTETWTIIQWQVLDASRYLKRLNYKGMPTYGVRYTCAGRVTQCRVTLPRKYRTHVNKIKNFN
jgi:hypothetical protein